jgi:cobyrinic acid a,c-diamide synthase
MGADTPTFLVSGTHSGVGKTTVSFTLMGLLERKGYRVQPFKIGPDFIDGGYHRLATGRDSINLDLWMMGWKGLEESFQEYSTKADVSVIEGMGALFDGKNGTTSGSSAQIAEYLKVPVVLVVDIWGATVTTGAVLEGLLRFDPKVKVAGILLNRAGSAGHAEMVLRSLKPRIRKKVIGYLLRSEDIEIPERHLGLRTLEENAQARRVMNAAVRSASKTIDIRRLARLLKLRRSHHVPKVPSRQLIPSEVRIGVAKDTAFCFYYTENLKMLERAGAELVPFSPIADKSLPKNLDGLYFGGGYPESFLPELSANHRLKKEILLKIKEGLPVYAECGGLMYLSQAIRGFEGRSYPMVAALSLKVAMARDHLTIRYVEIRTRKKTLLGPAGAYARGQEFHQSRIISSRYHGPFVYGVHTSDGRTFREGSQDKNLLASYIHLHFKSNPLIPTFFVKSCWDHRAMRKDRS